MRIAMMIAYAAMPAASGCATLPPPSDTNGETMVVSQSCDGHSAAPYADALVAVGAPVAVTNGLEDALRRVPPVPPTNVVPTKVMHPDVPADEFFVEDWAVELAEKAEQGIHIGNGLVLVVVRIHAMDGEYQTLTKLRAKIRAIEFLRHHYPELPKEFSASCRVLVSEQTDSGEECVVVMSFALKDIVKPEK